MDFGDILDAWENERHRKDRQKEKSAKEDDSQNTRGSGERSEVQRELERRLEEVEDWDSIRKLKEEEDPPMLQSRRKSLLRRMEPQERIDLHGMFCDSAERALRLFLYSAHKRGLNKVLIIHGKGNHSSGGPVLKDMVKRVLEKSPYAGETGTPGREMGGSGATWVLIK